MIDDYSKKLPSPHPVKVGLVDDDVKVNKRTSVISEPFPVASKNRLVPLRRFFNQRPTSSTTGFHGDTKSAGPQASVVADAPDRTEKSVAPNLTRCANIKRAAIQQPAVLPMSARGAFFASFGAAALFAACQIVRADIYFAELPGEPPAYASHPTDSGYRLYLRSETEAFPRILHPVAKPPSPQELALDAHIERAARKHQVDPALLRAVIETESRFDPRAVSPKGAVGAMQLMPATARRFGVLNRSDAARNIDAGTAYLKELLTRFGGNLSLALAAYNAGEGAVIRHQRRIPEFRETMLYVPQVLAAYAQYRQAKADAE